MKWEKEILNQLFFYDIIIITKGVHILKDKAFFYIKYHNIFMRLGCIISFKKCWNCINYKGLLKKTLIVSQPYHDVLPFYIKL